MTAPPVRAIAVENHLRAPRLRVALVGADGAGKSMLTRRLEHARLPFPVKRIYMGVNLEASTLMLPTTRLLLVAKRIRGGRSDLTAGRLVADPVPRARTRRRWTRAPRDAARMTVWVLEEWLRQLVAAWYVGRGYVVVFDRHFFADYYHSDVAGNGHRDRPARLHGWMLQHLYPKPDLVVCLDAPGEVLFARKPESSVAWLEQRRAQYLGLAGVVPAFTRIDADRPADDVFADVVHAICTYRKGTPS